MYGLWGQERIGQCVTKSSRYKLSWEISSAQATDQIHQGRPVSINCAALPHLADYHFICWSISRLCGPALPHEFEVVLVGCRQTSRKSFLFINLRAMIMVYHRDDHLYIRDPGSLKLSCRAFRPALMLLSLISDLSLCRRDLPSASSWCLKCSHGCDRCFENCSQPLWHIIHLVDTL